MNTATQKNTMQDQQHNKKAVAFAFKLKPVMTALVGVFGGGVALAQATSLAGVTMTGFGMKQDASTLNKSTTISTTNVTKGGVGINAFSQFSVGSGQTVNLLIPQNASAGLLNLVDHRIVVNGTVNSILNSGKVGGKVVFASPQGMLVGTAGVLNVGQLVIQTPKEEAFRDAYQQADRTATKLLIDQDPVFKPFMDGTVARELDKNVTIQGRVVAPNGISIDADNIVITGSLVASDRAALVTSLNGGVNAKSTDPWGTGTITDLVVDKFGNYDLVDASLDTPTGDIALSGRVIALSGAQIDNSRAKKATVPSGEKDLSVQLRAVGAYGLGAASITIDGGTKIDTHGGNADFFTWAQSGSTGDSTIKLAGATTRVLTQGGNLDITAWNGGESGKSSVDITGGTIDQPIIDTIALPATGAGNVTVIAKSDRTEEWKITNLAGQMIRREAAISIDGTVKAGNITVKAEATDNFSYSEKLSLLGAIKTDIKMGLEKGSESFGKSVGGALLSEVTTGISGVDVAFTQVDSKATVLLGSKAKLDAKNDVRILAKATSNSDLALRAMAPVQLLPWTIGFAWSDNNANSDVTVKNGASITSEAGMIDVKSKTDTSLNVDLAAMSQTSVAVLTGVVSRAEITANVTLEAGSTLTAEKQVSVGAENHTTSFKTAAASIAPGQGEDPSDVTAASSVGAAFAYAGSYTKATVTSAANITSNKAGIDITATNLIDANSLSASSVEDKTFGAGAIVGNLLKGNEDIVAMGFLQNTIGKKVAGLLKKIPVPNIGGYKPSGSGALALGFNDHYATVDITKAAPTTPGASQLTAAKNINIAATLVDTKPGASAASTVATKPPNAAGTGVGLAVATAYSHYDHTARAKIADKVIIQAGYGVNINSDVQVTNPQLGNMQTPSFWTLIPDTLQDAALTALFANGSTSSGALNYGSNNKSLALSLSVLQFDNKSEAIVGDGVQIKYGGSTATASLKAAQADYAKSIKDPTITAEALKAKKEGFEALWKTHYPTPNLITETLKASLFGESLTTAQAEQAWGIVLNDARRLSVDAGVQVSTLFTSGVAPLIASQSGGGAGTSAAAANVNYVGLKNTSTATIGKRADIQSDHAKSQLAVNAHNDIKSKTITWANAGDAGLGATNGNSGGGSVGLEGMFAIVNVNDQSHAVVDRSANVSVHDLTVNATEKLDLITDALGTSKTSGSGIGVAVALNIVNTDTLAGITSNRFDASGTQIFTEAVTAKDPTTGVETTTDKAVEQGSIKADTVAINAATSGDILALTVAAARKTPTPPSSTPPPPADDEDIILSLVLPDGTIQMPPGSGATGASQPKAGFTASGAVSVNAVWENTFARIDGAKIEARNTKIKDTALSVSALNDATDKAISGALALTQGDAGTNGNGAFAGGLSVNTMRNETQALITGAGGARSSITGMQSVSVDAFANGYQMAGTFGAAVTTAAGDTSSKSVAASAAASKSRNGVIAIISNTDINAAPDATAASVWGDAASKSTLENWKKRETELAKLRNEHQTRLVGYNLGLDGAMVVLAGSAWAGKKKLSQLSGGAKYAFLAGAAAAGTAELVGIGVLLSQRQQEIDALSAISAEEALVKQQIGVAEARAASAAAGSSVVVSAIDKNTLTTWAGGGGFGGNKAAGGAVTYSEIRDVVQATVQSSTVAGRKNFEVNAINASNITAVAVGAAVSTGAGGGGYAGTMAWNTVHNEATAKVSGSTIDVTDDAKVISGDAADAALSETTAKRLKGTLSSTDLDLSTVDMGLDDAGKAKLASDGSKIVTVAVSLAGATGGGNVAGLVLGYNTVNNTFGSTVESSEVAAATTTLKADSSAYILDVGIGATATTSGKSGAGVVAVSEVGNTISASAYSSDAKKKISTGKLSVSAKDRSQIDTFIGGLAISGSSHAAGVSIASSTIANTVSATLKSVDVSAMAPQNTKKAGSTDPDNYVQGADTDIAVNADNESKTRTVTLAAALSGDGYALGGVAANARIHNTTTADLTGVTTQNAQKVQWTDSQNKAKTTENKIGTVSVAATDNSNTQTFAVAIAGSIGSAAVAAAITDSIVENKTHAYLTGGVVNADTVKVDSSSASTVETMAVGVGGSKDGLAVSGSVVVNVVDNTTDAKIDGGAKVTAQNNVRVTAKGDDHIKVAAGSASFSLGGSGVGASVISNNVTSDTLAYIDGSTTEVNAYGVSAPPDADASVGNAFENYGDVDSVDTIAFYYTHSDLANRRTKDHLIDPKDPTKGRALNKVKGVEVNASSTQFVGSIVANVAGGKDVGAAGNIQVNSIVGKTQAYVNQAKVTAGREEDKDNNITASSGDVKVLAGNLSVSSGFAGAVGVGGKAGMGVGFDGAAQKHVTEAFLKGATVTARDIEVGARSAQATSSIAVAGGASPGLAMGVTGSITHFDGQTRAYIENGTTNAGGALRVTADSTTQAFAIGGALAGSGGAAAAVGIVDVNDNNITEAYIAGVGNETVAGKEVERRAKVDATEGVTVAATSKTTIRDFAVGIAGSGAVGIAGTVTVNKLLNTTEARVERADVGTKAGDAYKTGSLNVTADSSNAVFGVAGALGVGVKGGGLGASLLVNDIGNKARSVVFDSNVKVKNALTVQSTNQNVVEDYVVTGGGGLWAGVGAATVVTLVGAESGVEQADAINTNAADGTTKVLQDAQGNIRALAKTGQKDTTTFDKVFVKNTGLNQSTAQIGGKTVLDVGTLAVKSVDKTSIDNLSGGAALGGAMGGGASTSVAISRATVTARVDDSTYTEVRDSGVNSVEVSATATDTDDKIDISTGKLKDPDQATISAVAWAGSGSVVSGSSNTVSKVKLNNTVQAHLGGRVNAKGAVKVAASDKTSLKSRVVGGAVGTAALGLTFNVLGKTSQVTAELGVDARLPAPGANDPKGISTGGRLSVTAENSGALRGYTTSGSIGAVAVQVSAGVGGTQINDSTQVTAQTLAESVQNATGGMSVLAMSAADVYAQNWGLSVGGLAVGVSEAQGTANQRVSALLGEKSQVKSGGAVTVDAQQTMARVSAFTSGASGGLVGVAGTTSTANNTSEITSAVGDESSIETSGAVTVNAAAKSLQTADAWGVAVGAIGAGTHTALAQSDTKTKAMLGKNVDLHGVADGKGGFNKAGDLTVTAISADQNFSRAKSGSGGLVGGADANALTISNSTTAALIGQGTNKAKMLKVAALKVEATHTALFNGVVESFNFNVAGGGSGPYAEHLVNSSVTAELGDGVQVEAETATVNAKSTTKKENKGDTVYNYNTLMVDWDANKVIDWNIDSRSGALLVDIPVGTAITEVTKQDTTARIGNGAHVQLNGKQPASSNALVMDAINSIDIYDKVGVDTGGLVPVASAKSLLTVKNASTNATIGGLAKVKANKGAIAVGARTDAKLSAEAVANTYGLAGSPFGSALASYTGSDNVTVGASAELLADYNSVNLSAGRSTSGTESSVETSSKVNIWNKTLLPIKNPPEAITNIDSKAKLATHGLSKILADGDVNLIATRGTLKATALGISRDLYGNSKVQSGSVSDLLDKDGIPTQTVTGNAAKPTGTAQVVVDGTVETGIHRVQWLTLDDAVLLGEDGKPVIDLKSGKPVYVDNITKSEGFGHVSIAYNQSVAQALYARLQTKRKQALDYAGTASAGAYANEVTFLEKQLLDLGFASKVANGKGGYDIVMGTGGGVGISPKEAVQQQIEASNALLTAGNLIVTELKGQQATYLSAKTAAQTALDEAPTKATNAADAFSARADALANWLAESKKTTPNAPLIAGYKTTIVNAEATISGSGVTVANYTAVAPKADTPSPTQALIDGAKANAENAPGAGTALVAAAQTKFDQQNKNYEDTGKKITETQTSIAGYQTSIKTLTELEKTASSVQVNGPVADFVTTPDIKINLGSIRVKAESLSGIGALNAPGDAKVTITNHTSKYLTVGGISINSASDGARVVFNGKDVGSNADINAINAKSAVGELANFAKITTLANGAKPLVDIVSNYNPDSLASSQAHKPGSAPDINLVGRIDNVGGTVKVHSKAGTIRSEGTVRAGTVDIQANNGDFVQSYVDEFFQLAAPADPSGNQTQLPGTAVAQGTASNGSLIMANGSVLLSARYLNINGTVQSGYANYELSIGDKPVLTASFDSMGVTQEQINKVNGDLLAQGKDLAILDIKGRGGDTGLTYNKKLARLEFTTAYAKADYAAKADKTVSAYGLLQNTENTSDKQYIGASYDAKSNRLVVDGTAVQGGYIQIYGQVYNTAQNGAGKLKALDGYGQINITNTSGLDIELTKLDTGKGVAGVIEISDIQSLNADTGVATIKKTTYTRENGKVKVAVVNVDKSTSTSWSDGRTASYKPQEDLTYTYQTGSDASKRTDYRWQGTQWLGNTDWRTDGAPLAGSTVLVGPYDLQNTKLEQAQFLSVRNGFSAYGKQAAEEVKGSAGDARKFKTNEWSVCDWWLCITQQYYIDYSIVTPIKTIQSTIIKADNPIGIEFIGADTGKINVQSNSNVLLSGAISNKIGKTTIEAGGVAKSIVRTNDDALVSAASFDFKATASVGAAGMAIKTETGDKAVPGLFNAAATQGNVHIDQTQGAIKVGTITAGGTRYVAAKADANGTVTQAAVFNDVGVVELKAQGDIVAGAGSASLIQGDKVDLRSAHGAIGSTAAPLTVNVAYSDDLTTRGFNGLTASAAKDIGIKTNTWAQNADGSLLLNTVASAGGDVKLVAPGRMVDNNPNETIDTRTWKELTDYWDSLGLRSGTQANADKQTNMLKTYVEAKNAGYKDYWELRKGAVVDAKSGKLVVKLSEQQTASFKAQGTSDAEIAQIVAGKQKALTDLGKVYGVDGSSEYDAHFNYVMSQKEKDDLLRGVAWTDKQLAVAISPGALKTITNTNPVVKVANVQGNTVSLQAGKGIGETYVATAIDLKNFDPSKLTPAQKVALAAAERSDFGFNGNMLTVLQRKPLNFDASTQLNASGVGLGSAIDGTAFLASRKDGNLGTIHVSGETRIKVLGSLVNAGTSSVRTGNLVLEAAEGAIGAGVSAPLELQLGAGSTLTARAARAVAVHDSGNMQVDAVYSRDAIYLAADGSMTRAADNDLLNVLGNGVTLKAGGSIGATDKALNVAVDSDESQINATSDKGSVYLAGVSGNRFLVDSVTAANSIGLTAQDDLAIAGKLTATSGDISLSTDGAVLDGGTVADAVVAQAQNGTVTINAKAGVGTEGTAGNAFEVQANKLQASASQGAVTMTVAQTTGVELVGEGVTARDGVTLLTNGGVTGTAVTSTGAGKNVDIKADRGVVLTKVSSGGDATLTASVGSVVATTLLATGAINTGANGKFEAKTINAKALTANANAIALGQATVTDATDLTAAGWLSATTLTTGTVTAKSTGGNVNMTTLTSTGNATITAQGGATLGTATVGDKDHAADLSVTASAGSVVATSLVASGVITTSANGTFDAKNVNAKALTAKATYIALGQATVTDATDLTAAGLLSATTLTTGTVTAKSTGGGVNLTTLTSTGNATISAQGNATLGTATVGDKDHASDLSVTASAGSVVATNLVASGVITTSANGTFDAKNVNAKALTAKATYIALGQATVTDAADLTAAGLLSATTLTTGSVIAKSTGGSVNLSTLTSTGNASITAQGNATLGTATVGDKDHASDLSVTATEGLAEVTTATVSKDLVVKGVIVRMAQQANAVNMTLTATGGDLVAANLVATGAIGTGALGRFDATTLKAKALTANADTIALGQATVTDATDLTATGLLSATTLTTGSLVAKSTFSDVNMSTLSSTGNATVTALGGVTLGTATVGDATHASDLTVTASTGDVVATTLLATGVITTGAKGKFDTQKVNAKALTAKANAIALGQATVTDATDLKATGLLSATTLTTGSLVAKSTFSDVNMTTLTSTGNATVTAKGSATLGTATVGDKDHAADLNVTAGRVALGKATVTGKADLTATDEDVVAKEMAAALAVLGAKARAQVDVLKAKQLQMTADSIGVGQAEVDGSTELSASKALRVAKLATGSLAATAESADITTLTSVGHATVKTQGSASLGAVTVGDAQHASDLTVTASKGAVDVASIDVTRDVVLSGTSVNVGTLKNGRNLSLTATTGDLIAADLVSNGAVAASVGGALRVKSLSGDSVTASAATAEVTSLNSRGNAAFTTSGDATFGSVSVGDAKRVADFGVTASAGLVKLSTATVSQDAVLKGNQVDIGSLTVLRDATLEASKDDVTATAPSIAATVLKANRLAVTTPGTLLLTDAMVGDRANFVLRAAKAKLRNDGKAPMVLSVSGKTEDVADNVDLQITSARGVDFRKLWAKVATVTSSTNQNSIRDGYITGQLAYESPIGALWMNNVDRTSVVGKRVQLFADTKRFTLLQEGKNYVTDAFVSYFDPLNVYSVSTNTNFNAAPGANTGVSLERDTNKLQSGNALSDIRSRYTAATLSGITDLRTVDFNALPPTASGVTEEEAEEWEQYISQAQ